VKVRRIAPERSLGTIIDVQGFFLSQAVGHQRSRLKANTRSLARLLGYFRIPVLVTLERPVAQKGALPKEIERDLGGLVQTFEKDFFDLTKERKIRDHLDRLRRTQAIVAGCETDVCVLQSCLGLLGLGYEVYVVEDLLFSSSRDVEPALARMRAEGAVLLTYKSLYYELMAAVEGGRHAERMLAAYGPFPDDLQDCASH
jgi:nicotinamidase-related amidase